MSVEHMCSSMGVDTRETEKEPAHAPGGTVMRECEDCETTTRQTDTLTGWVCTRCALKSVLEDC